MLIMTVMMERATRSKILHIADCEKDSPFRGEQICSALLCRVRKDETIEGKVRELGQANRSVRAKRERMIKMSSR